jgi:hypothetical protein
LHQICIRFPAKQLLFPRPDKLRFCFTNDRYLRTRITLFQTSSSVRNTSFLPNINGFKLVGPRDQYFIIRDI